MPQRRRAVPAVGRSPCRHRSATQGAASRFSAGSPCTARRQLVKPAQSPSAETWASTRSRRLLRARSLADVLVALVRSGLSEMIPG
jgi:hypothetical protein